VKEGKTSIPGQLIRVSYSENEKEDRRQDCRTREIMVKMERKPKFEHNKPKFEHKPREERFGNLVSKPDEIKKGQYVPWARFQKPGAVKEVTFHAESRR